MIASALAQAAEVLLLDEPTASLDPRFQFEIAALLGALNREQADDHGRVDARSELRRVALHRARAAFEAGACSRTDPTRDVLTERHIRALYDVDADVSMHARAGHLTVVPVGRTD